jgi:hypothetical protein
MHLPTVRSSEHPSAPEWLEYEFDTQQDYIAFKQGIAAIVGYDDQTDSFTLFGSGIIFGSHVEMHVATATHVLTHIANDYYGAIPSNPFLGVEDRTQKELHRLKRLTSERRVRVLVETIEYGPLQMFDVIGLVGGEEMGVDCVLLQCQIPETLMGNINFLPIVMDDDPVVENETLIMAGFVQPKVFKPRERPSISAKEFDRIGILRSNLVTRVSRVAEITTEPGRVKPGATHVRVAMPSEHGMSGGPVVRLRGDKGRRPRVAGEAIITTTVGIVSRQADGTDANGEPVEHTWESPWSTHGRPQRAFYRLWLVRSIT